MKKAMKRVIVMLLPLLSIWGCSKEQKVDNVNVMTFNIRYDNPADSLNNWSYRKDNVVNCIKFYDVDLLGMQEVLHNQLEDIKMALPEYASIGVGRLDGKEAGEYSPILYKKDKFELISSGYFWLSETPNIAGSLGWDSACERIATWGHFKDKQSNKELLMLNTHLDHVGKVARIRGVKLIIDSLYNISKGLPVVISGDFNAVPTSEVVKYMLNPTNKIKMLSSGDIANVYYGSSWSFHDFGRLPYDERPLIDYIFVSKGIDVYRYGVLSEYDGKHYLSDHCPVLVTLRI